MANDWYLKVSGAWKQVNEAYIKQSGAWKEIQEAYIKVSGAWKLFYVSFVATAFVNKTTPGTSTAVVPDGANAIHIQAAVGGGAAGVDGADYDKAGGESGGTGGGSGAYISDRIYAVSEGETLTFTVGDGPVDSGASRYNQTAPSGGSTSLSGSSTGTIFILGGGGGGSGLNGGVQGPLRTNNPSSGGTFQHQDPRITSGTFKESDGSTSTVDNGTASLKQGPRGTFNTGANGTAGVTGANCSGDNCQQDGGSGADSYGGSISGGSGADTSAGTNGGNGTRGSGGGGGGAQVPGGFSTNGGHGGDGEIRYRFLRIN